MKAAALVGAILLAGCTRHEDPAQATQPDWTRIEDCGAQAEHEFAELGYSRKDTKDLRVLADFTNHYDAERAICFLLSDATTSDANSIIVSKLLEDANERKIYGSFESSSRAPKGESWRTSIIDCFVLAEDGNGKRACATSDEFDAMVKPFMDRSAARIRKYNPSTGKLE